MTEGHNDRGPGVIALPGRWALVIVDMQQAGYADRDEAGLQQMPGFGERVGRLATVLERCRQTGAPVVHLQEVHRRSMLDFGRELDGSEGPHFLEGDTLTEIVPRLAPAPGEPHIVKRRYSGFFGTDLDIVLRGLGVAGIVLAGELTDVCVHYTFVDAHQLDYHVRVIEDCCGGSTRARHDAALDAMAYLQSAARCTAEEILAALDRRSLEAPDPAVSTGPGLRAGGTGQGLAQAI
jgi:nicotinamidase-related amidase